MSEEALLPAEARKLQCDDTSCSRRTKPDPAPVLEPTCPHCQDLKYRLSEAYKLLQEWQEAYRKDAHKHYEDLQKQVARVKELECDLQAMKDEARIAIQQLANRKPAEPVPPTEGKCWIVRFSNNPSFTIFGIFATRDAANAAAAHYGTGNNLVVEEHPIQLAVITMGRLVTP